MSSVTYYGEAPNHVSVERYDEALQRRIRYPLAHVRVHSPTGFAWGYDGSGPADLALAILADYFGEVDKLRERYDALGTERKVKARIPPKCVQHYQGFKWSFINPLQGERWQSWSITGDRIALWLAARSQPTISEPEA